MGTKGRALYCRENSSTRCVDVADDGDPLYQQRGGIIDFTSIKDRVTVSELGSVQRSVSSGGKSWLVTSAHCPAGAHAVFRASTWALVM